MKMALSELAQSMKTGINTLNSKIDAKVLFAFDTKK